MWKIRIYPSGFWVRVFFWVAVVVICAALAVWVYRYTMNGETNWVLLSLLAVLVIELVLIGTFSQPSGVTDRYSTVITDIENIRRQLTRLEDFLKGERAKIEDSKATLERLRDEKTQLEPVVTTQREVVNAILAAHAKTTASRAWKERAVGFTSGVLASLLAALVFELFKH